MRSSPLVCAGQHASSTAEAGPRLLALPGLGLGDEAWRPTILRYGGPATVLGIPGYGVREGRRRDLSPRALAAEVLVTDALDPGPVVLLGHSASCQVAAHVAELAPARVSALVLVGPTTDPANATWPRIAAQWLRTASAEDTRQVPCLLRQWSRTGPMTMLRAMEAARRDRIDHVLRRVEIPLLVIRGLHDDICRSAWAAELVKGRPGPAPAAAVTLPAGAHMVPYTHGALVAAAIRSFVARTGFGRTPDLETAD